MGTAVKGIPSWTRFEILDGNLVAHGIIKSVRDDDLASDLIRKLDVSIPHEASIGWDDEVEIEFVDDGEVCAANGKVFVGPLYCIRAFYVRELSIVDLGACPGTETTLDDNAEQSAPEPVGDTVNEPAVYSFNAVIRPRYACSKSETSPVEPEKGVEADAVVEDSKQEPEQENETQLSASKMAEYSKEFGAENAIAYFCVEKLDEAAARQRFCEQLKNELQQQREQLAALSAAARSGSPTVDFIPSDDPNKQEAERVEAFARKAGVSKAQAGFISKYLKD